MRLHVAFALVIASLPLTRSSVACQAAALPASTVDIERLVAQYAQRLVPKGKVVLDPWTRTPFSPNTRVERTQRDSSSLADLARIAGLTAVQGLVFTCDAQGQHCRIIDGVDGVITISRPELTGDRAEVMVAVTTRSTARYQAVHEYEETVEVVREGTQWRVVGPTRARAS